jgi:hypothetical protein
MNRRRRVVFLACLIVVPGTATASASRGPFRVPQGAKGNLRPSDALRVSVTVPSDYKPYVTINGTPSDGAFTKSVTVGSRVCQIVLRVSGLAMRSRPTVAALTSGPFVATARGVSGARHWTLGRQSSDWLAVSWRTATPSTRSFGRYIAVLASLSTDPPPGTTCRHALANERSAAQNIAPSWVLVRRR